MKRQSKLIVTGIVLICVIIPANSCLLNPNPCACESPPIALSICRPAYTKDNCAGEC